MSPLRIKLAGSVSAFSGVPAHHLGEDTDLSDDIGLDDDERAQLLDDIAKEHEITFDGLDQHEIITFGQLVARVGEKLAVPQSVDASWGDR